MPGGESGIRTRVRVSPKHAFQACAFSHSAISPRSIAPIVMKSGGGVQRDAYSEFGTVALPNMGMLFLRQNKRGRAVAGLPPLQDPDGVAYRDGTSGFDFREHAPAALQILLQAGPDFVHAAARPTGLGNPQPHH